MKLNKGKKPKYRASIFHIPKGTKKIIIKYVKKQPKIKIKLGDQINEISSYFSG